MKQSAPKPKIFTPIFRGGLGNNLYQIAIALSLAKNNHGEAIFYNQSESDEKDYRPFGGHRLVKKKGLPTSLQELFPRLKFYPEVKKHTEVKESGQVFSEKEIRSFVPSPKFYSDTILDGYFFAHQYFKNDLASIRKSLRPDVAVENYINEKYGYLLNDQSVSLHFRMGNTQDNFIPDEIPIEWYKRILRRFNRNHHFLVCSDDIPRAERILSPLLNKYDFYFIENEPMYIDLFVMAKCEHHILHNSTLSAWSALLDEKGNSKVYVFDPLFAQMHGENAVMPGWKVPGRRKRLLIEQWKTIKIGIKDHFQRFLNWLKELKRDFMYKVFGTYYTLNHEKEDYNQEK